MNGLVYNEESEVYFESVTTFCTDAHNGLKLNHENILQNISKFMCLVKISKTFVFFFKPGQHFVLKRIGSH